MLNVDEFKEVAEKLSNFKSLPDGGKYRTAIGRYYYYIFLKIREIIKEVEKDREDGIYGLLNTGKAHRALPAYFRALSKKVRVNKLRNSFIELAEALEDLRELRNSLSHEYPDDLPEIVDTINEVFEKLEFLEGIYLDIKKVYKKILEVKGQK